MNKVINTIIIWSKKLIPVFGCITLFLIILQRLGLDRWILLIYHALIPIFVGGVITFFLQPFINRLHRYISYKMSVSIIGKAVIEPPPYFLLSFTALSNNLECR